MNKLEVWQLVQRQTLPLNAKIELSKQRIREFYEHCNGKVYVSYSGGKDSEVMRDLVLQCYPDVNVIFVDTGTELDTRDHAMKKATKILKPRKPMLEIWNKYGIPFPSKQQAYFIYQAKHTNSDYLRSRLMTGIMADGSPTKFKISEKWKKIIDSDIEVSNRCCYYLRKEPFAKYKKLSGESPYIGTMAADGLERKKGYLRTGCINYEKEMCTPLGFWTEQDVLGYIKKYELDYCEAYGDIVKVDGMWKTTKADRTGCVGCGFGVQMESSPNRFQRMAVDNPKLHDIVLHKWCNGNMGKVLDLCGIKYNAVEDEEVVEDDKNI